MQVSGAEMHGDVYDRVAHVLHVELSDHEQVATKAAYNTVVAMAGALSTAFQESDPEFDRERFLRIVMSGWDYLDSDW